MKPPSCNVCSAPMARGGNCDKCRVVRARLSRMHKEDGPNWKAYRLVKKTLIERYEILAAEGRPLF